MATCTISSESARALHISRRVKLIPDAVASAVPVSVSELSFVASTNYSPTVNTQAWAVDREFEQSPTRHALALELTSQLSQTLNSSAPTSKDQLVASRLGRSSSLRACRELLGARSELELISFAHPQQL